MKMKEENWAEGRGWHPPTLWTVSAYAMKDGKTYGEGNAIHFNNPHCH